MRTVGSTPILDNITTFARVASLIDNRVEALTDSVTGIAKRGPPEFCAIFVGAHHKALVVSLIRTDRGRAKVISAYAAEPVLNRLP